MTDKPKPEASVEPAPNRKEKTMTAKEFYEANATTTVNVPLSKRAGVGHPEDKSGWDGVQRARQAQYIAPDVEVMPLWDVFDFAEKFRQAGAASQGEGWVSVEKSGNPPKSYNYLACTNGNVEEATYFKDDDAWQSVETYGIDSEHEVLHPEYWMALPAAPPKEEE